MITPDMRAVIAAAHLCFALLAVEHAAPLFSPAYWRGYDESALRTIWRERRAALDEEFGAHLAHVGPANAVNGPT